MNAKKTLALILATAMIVGCAGVRTTRFENPRFDFSYVEKVAVLPFENLCGEQQAGVRATRLFITELLASGAVDVVEPGEVNAALNKLVGAESTPSNDQIVSLGEQLEVQAVIMGSVTECGALRSGNVAIPVITLDVHMVETDTGTPVWAATHTEKGGGFGARILGTAGEANSETMRRCIKKLVKKLVS